MLLVGDDSRGISEGAVGRNDETIDASEASALKVFKEGEDGKCDEDELGDEKRAE